MTRNMIPRLEKSTTCSSVPILAALPLQWSYSPVLPCSSSLRTHGRCTGVLLPSSPMLTLIPPSRFACDPRLLFLFSTLFCVNVFVCHPILLRVTVLASLARNGRTLMMINRLSTSDFFDGPCVGLLTMAH